MDAEAGRRLPEAAGLEDRRQGPKSLLLHRVATDQHRGEQLASLAEPIGQVAHVAEQEVRGEARSAGNGRRLVERLGGLQRRPGGRLGRRPGARLLERPGHGDDATEERCDPAGDREALRVIGGCRGHQAQLKALARSAEREPARRYQQAQFGPGLLASGDVVGAVRGGLAGQDDDPRRSLGRKRVAAPRLLSGLADGGVPRELQGEQAPRSGPPRSARARSAGRRPAGRDGRRHRARRPGRGSRPGGRPRRDWPGSR